MKKKYLHIFAIHSSSRHEKRCWILERIFCLFLFLACSEYQDGKTKKSNIMKYLVSEDIHTLQNWRNFSTYILPKYYICTCYKRLKQVKVSYFQNEFMKSSFLSKYIWTKNCQDFCPHYTGQKSGQFFVLILGETMISSIHSEINWTLLHTEWYLKETEINVDQYWCWRRGDVKLK